VSLPAGQFLEKSVQMEVLDGRLTLHAASSTEKATRINFILIVPLPLPTATPAPVTPQQLKINFQPKGVEIPPGYIPDFGEVLAGRSGYSYGWNVASEDVVRDRNRNENQANDTLIHVHAGAKWELALPPGNYEVTVSIGDACFSSTHTVNVEGINYWAAFLTQANQFVKTSRLITVQDGLLTIDAGNSPEKLTRINYIEIVYQALPAPTPTISPTVAPTPSPTVTPVPTFLPVPGWEPCVVSPEQVNIIPVPEQKIMYVDITFPDSGYRLADKGAVTVAAAIRPDGTTYLSNITAGTRIEKYTGISTNIITTLRITYQIYYGDTTYFAFNIYHNGEEKKIKEITVIK
jgi:hypothetical protein